MVSNILGVVCRWSTPVSPPVGKRPTPWFSSLKQTRHLSLACLRLESRSFILVGNNMLSPEARGDHTPSTSSLESFLPQHYHQYV